LQRFRGELTLLDSKGGGGRSEGDYESDGSFGRSSPMERAPAERRPAAAPAGRLSEQLDDDIPF
jgi:single-strand DNA-binding protein